MTLFTLLLSSILQALAALAAMLQIRRTGRYRFAWVCVSLALILMVERRLLPLWRHLHGSGQNEVDAVFGLLISLLMLAGVIGLGKLLADLAAQDEQLRVLASTDALTGLANRRAIHRHLIDEFERCQRNGHALSVLMLDLDHFKAINDCSGHAAGDLILQAVGDACRSKLRRIDLAGRWGGEEFVVLMPDTASEEAVAAAERLRAAIGEIAVAEAGTVLRITASIGVATYRDDVSPDKLLANADAALYEAKRLGRNRTVLWDEARPASA